MADLPKRHREHILEEESLKFVERIIPSEWNQGTYKRDYGIDLLYEIFVNDITTGANFSIQIKATDKLKIRKKGYIAHPLETSTLRYFLERPELVVFVIYDASKGKGYWLWIQDFIRNKLDPNWKHQKTATIQIPSDNVFDQNSLERIEKRVLKFHKAAKWSLAAQTANNDFFKYDFSNKDGKLSISVGEKYPGATKDKPVTTELLFKFDHSIEAQAALESLDQALKTGKKAAIDSRFFEIIKAPEAFTCLFPEKEFDIHQIEIGTAKYDYEAKLRLTILDNENKVLFELPYIELKIVQAGSEEVTVSNEHQKTPFKVKIKSNKKEKTDAFLIWVAFDDDSSASEILKILRLKQALVCGKWIKLTNLITGNSGQDKLPDISFEDVNPDLLEFAIDLASIEQIVSQKILWPEEISQKELSEAKKTVELITTGHTIKKQKHIRLIIEKKFAKNIANDFSMRKFPPLHYSYYGSNYLEILDNKLKIGAITIRIPIYKPTSTTLKRLQKLGSLSDSDKVRIELDVKEPGIYYFFHDWLPKEQLDALKKSTTNFEDRTH